MCVATFQFNRISAKAQKAAQRPGTVAELAGCIGVRVGGLRKEDEIMPNNQSREGGRGGRKDTQESRGSQGSRGGKGGGQKQSDRSR
jgi:hypothetical protein